MLLGGDELGRTQGGNNNAYCQDNEISWYRLGRRRRPTSPSGASASSRSGADHPVFRRRRWFQGRQIRGIEDLAWLRPDGEEMTDDDWDAGFARAVGVFMNGGTIPTTDAYGERIVDDTFLVIFNAGDQPIDWSIPGPEWSRRWTIDLDTADPRRGVGRTVNKRPGDAARGPRPLDGRAAVDPARRVDTRTPPPSCGSPGGARHRPSTRPTTRRPTSPPTAPNDPRPNEQQRRRSDPMPPDAQCNCPPNDPHGWSSSRSDRWSTADDFPAKAPLGEPIGRRRRRVHRRTRRRRRRAALAAGAHRRQTPATWQEAAMTSRRQRPVHGV